MPVVLRLLWLLGDPMVLPFVLPLLLILLLLLLLLLLLVFLFPGVTARCRGGGGRGGGTRGGEEIIMAMDWIGLN